MRSLKGLEDIIQLVTMDSGMTAQGWYASSSSVSTPLLFIFYYIVFSFRAYTGLHGTDPKDPLYGFTLHRQLYLKADPSYAGRFTVPVLWDKKRETIVNNESSEIIRMFYSAFDSLLPPERRESAHPLGGYYPEAFRKEIDEMNEWVYDTVNNGVYKTGFATSQAAYEESCDAVFASLDRLEAILEQNEKEGKGKYLFGGHLTEADIRLYPTIARFDVGYYTLFQCNLKMIRHDYPRLHGWLRRLYWDEDVSETKGAFKKTTYFDHVSVFRLILAKREPGVDLSFFCP